jgi:hypothetical protein
MCPALRRASDEMVELQSRHSTACDNGRLRSFDLTFKSCRSTYAILGVSAVLPGGPLYLARRVCS